MKELKERLEQLEINVSQDDEGRITVYSTSEPAFCFVADDLSHAKSLVVDTLISYANTFFGIEREDISVEEKDIEQKRTIPEIALQNTKTLTPRLGAA